MINVTVGFENMEDDKSFNFAFNSDDKTAVEKALTNHLTMSGEADGWVFANWRSETKTGTVFNPNPRSKNNG